MLLTLACTGDLFIHVALDSRGIICCSWHMRNIELAVPWISATVGVVVVVVALHAFGQISGLYNYYAEQLTLSRNIDIYFFTVFPDFLDLYMFSLLYYGCTVKLPQSTIMNRLLRGSQSPTLI